MLIKYGFNPYINKHQLMDNIEGYVYFGTGADCDEHNEDDGEMDEGNQPPG